MCIRVEVCSCVGIRDSGHIHTCTETHIHIHTHSDVASCTHCYTHEFHKPTSMYSLTLNSLLTSVYSAIHFNSHFTCIHNHTPTSQHSAPSTTPHPRRVPLCWHPIIPMTRVGWGGSWAGWVDPAPCGIILWWPPGGEVPHGGGGKPRGTRVLVAAV